MSPESVKVGDKIYLFTYGRINRIETVIRLTKTMIRSENYNYDYPNGKTNYLHIKGDHGRFSTLMARLETPELKKEWHDVLLRNWLSHNWQHIATEDIEAIKKKVEATRNG